MGRLGANIKLNINVNPIIKHKNSSNLGGIISTKVIEDKPNEIWKTIDEFPNYMFSNYGRIKNIKLNIFNV